MSKKIILLTCVCINTFLSYGVEPPVGYQNAFWGMPPADVQKATNTTQWQKQPADESFPKELNITLYTTTSIIAGYQAKVTYYFFEDQFIQVTIKFNFDNLINFDFNYNVFISVDKYYRAIHNQTLTFVTDIYDLLRKKYGKKQPVFKGLDPRYIFKYTDLFIKQELWNLRYHPSEYYKRIVTSAYARWDFPKTKIIFSINISAKDKRFDYLLSLSSLDYERVINKQKDILRMEGL